MRRLRSFRRGARQVWLRSVCARITVFLALVAAVMLTVRCTRELNPARGEGGLALTWKAGPGVTVATADSARTWVLDGQDRILVGPVVAPFHGVTGSFDISLRVPAGEDRAVRMQLEGPGARGRGVCAEGEARGIAVAAAGNAEALLLLRNAVPQMEPFTGQPGDLQITLRWTAVPGASHYRVYRRPSVGTETFEVVVDTVRVFERTDLARWSREAIGDRSRGGSAAKARGWSRPNAGMSRRMGTEGVARSPAALDTTWFRVSAILRPVDPDDPHGLRVSVTSDSVAVSFGWIEDTPHVVPGGVIPDSGAVGVPDSVAVEIEFDRPMDPSSLGDLSVPSADNPVNLRVDGTMEFVTFRADSIDWREGDRRLRLRPAIPLRRDTRYLLQVTTDLRDPDGRPLDQFPTEAGLQAFESRFDTEHDDPLRVIGVVPADTTGISTRQLFEMQLNRSARPITVNEQTVLLTDSAGVAVPCSVTQPQGSLIRVTPGLPLRFGMRYQLTATTSVRDLRGRYGEPLDQDPSLAGPQPFIRSFRTVPQPRGPRVIAVVPDSGATGVPLSQVVRVRFSRPVQASTVSGYFTVLSSGVAAIRGDVAPSAGDPAEFTFTPEAPLQSGFLYAVEAWGSLDLQGNPVGIRDELGVPFDQDSTIAGYQKFRSTFFAEKSPRVDSWRPKPRVGGVPVDTLVELHFTWPMDRTSVTTTNLALFGGANPVSVVQPLEWSSDGKLVRLRPIAPLEWFRTYTIVADTSLRSTDGSHFDQNPETSGYQSFRADFQTAPDGIPPRVLSWTPGAVEGVPTSTTITVRFTKPVRPSDALSASNIFVRKLPSGLVLSARHEITGDSLVATLWPDSALDNDVEYEVTAKKFIEDRFGQQLDQDSVTAFNQDFTGRFRTEIERVPPRVATVHPGLGEEVDPVNATVAVTFTEPMGFEGTLTGAFSLSGPGGAVTGGTILSPDGDSLLVFTPVPRLRYAARYDVKVDTTATDRVGNLFDQFPEVGGRQPFTSFFVTAPDRVPPWVQAWVPADSAVGVPVTVHPEVTFSEAMATSTVPYGLRLLDSLRTEVRLVVDILDDRHAVLIPVDSLRRAERYTLEATEAARDTSGNGLDQDRVMPGFQPSQVWFRTEDFPPPVAHAGNGVCDPETSLVTLAASGEPVARLSRAEVDWGDGTPVETITIPGGQWPSPSHTYPCLDIRGCNREDDDQDGSVDETGSAGCDESYRIRLRVMDRGGPWSAWDSTGVSFCNLQVLSSTPAAGATGVDTLITELRLRFTRPLLADSVDAAHFTLVDTLGLSVSLTAALALDPDSAQFVILRLLPLPSVLQPGMKYTVRALPGIQSADGRIFGGNPCTPGVQPFEAVFHTQVRDSRPLPAPPPPHPSGPPAQEGRARSR